jgi:phosphoglycerate dehydrogenase-like enzyme
VQTPRPIPEVDEVHSLDDLVKVAPLLDYIVLLSPLTDKTRNLINAKVLAAMKPDAILINLARGALVDYPALIAALKEKRIGGAGLDTFTPEPLPADSPLWDMENVLITPHLAGVSDIYPQQALTIVEENVRHYLAGNYNKMINLIRGPACGCGK